MTIRAGGGVVWRRVGEQTEVVLVHRPRYDDWTLPKGKADRGEGDAETALREVSEETGLTCALGQELPGTRYIDNRGRPKVVRYWAMTVTQDADAPFEPNDEIDAVEWVDLMTARARLTYARDLPVLDAFAADIG